MGIRAIETLHLHPGVINRGGTDEHGGVGGGYTQLHRQRREAKPVAFAATARNGL